METSTYMPSSWGILGVCVGGWLQSCKSWRGIPRFLFAHFCELRQTVVNINGFMDFKIILTKWTNGLNRGHRLSSLQFSCSVVSDSLRPHESQHARPPCPSPTPGVYSNSCPLSQWCHPTISSSVVPFSSCLQSSPALGSFQMSQFFASGGQSIGVSASRSVLPMNIQDSFPLQWTGWISLQSKRVSRVLSNPIVQKHQFFGTQLSLQSNFHIHTWLLEKP